jgi:hypothetical protein
MPTGGEKSQTFELATRLLCPLAVMLDHVVRELFRRDPLVSVGLPPPRVVRDACEALDELVAGDRWRGQEGERNQLAVRRAEVEVLARDCRCVLLDPGRQLLRPADLEAAESMRELERRLARHGASLTGDRVAEAISCGHGRIFADRLDGRTALDASAASLDEKTSTGRMNRRAAQLERAVWELVVDGCDDEEALAALVERFGDAGLSFRFKLRERKRDRRAKHEERRLGAE